MGGQDFDESPEYSGKREGRVELPIGRPPRRNGGRDPAGAA